MESFGVGKGTESEMEKKIEKMMRTLKDDIVREMGENIEKCMEIMRREMQEERKKREEEWREEKKKWEEEKEELQRRIARLEMDQERRERERRKKNVVIKGISCEKTKIEEGVESFIQEKLGVEVRIERAHAIRVDEGKQIIVATVEKWEMKRQIMMKKRDLEKGIYIDDDLTKREREIQGKIRRITKEEREKGKEVKIGYMKASIEGKWLRWNEKEERLEEERRRVLKK